MTGSATTPTTELIEYSMPSLGADMDEGSVVEWLVEVGDTVERGQVVARVETEKSDIDIEIWHAGVVAEVVVPTNRIVPVGTLLLRLRSTDQAVIAAPPSAPNRADVVPASPLARRLAGERGILLRDVAGTGPRGAVRARDVSEAEVRTPVVAAPTAAPTAGSPDRSATRSDRMRTVIAQRMARSNLEIPHYRLERAVDLDALLRRLAVINDGRPVADRIVPAAAFVQAVAHAAGRHPELNGTWTEDRFCPGGGVNVSVAISLRTGGLVTPTIPDADGLSLDEMMERIRDYTAAARSGTLRSEWMRDDSTITVTNLGDRGADLVHGLISPPQVALVGFGRILERPWVVDGAIVPRSVVNVTLGADHRATDGAIGSRFLSTLARFLEEPDQ